MRDAAAAPCPLPDPAASAKRGGGFYISLLSLFSSFPFFALSFPFLFLSLPQGERTRAIIRRQLKNRCPLNSPEGNVIRGARLRVRERSFLSRG